MSGKLEVLLEVEIGDDDGRDLRRWRRSRGRSIS
jgi:hypothetical protein